MVSSETMLNDPDCEVPLKIHIDDCDEYMGFFISTIKKPTAFFLIIMIKKHN